MQVNPSYGVSPGNNGAASSVARQVSSGPGVSTSNLDSTRTRIVKRGCVVEFPGGATARVAKVRLGYLIVDVPSAQLPTFVMAMRGQRDWFVHRCSLVRVIA